ncbi:MAG: GNAT family N-acetyltransferase [Pseudomonadota bacterium]
MVGDENQEQRPAIAPRITTERLILRSFQRDDFDTFCATRAKPEVMQHIASKPFTRSQLWEKFLRGPGLWSLAGYGVWAIERREDGRLIGEVGFADYQRDLEPPLPGQGASAEEAIWPEASWLLDSDAHGKGYASEALAAALAWADTALQTPIICIISPSNKASLRLAARHGFLVVGHRVHKGDPVIVFQRNLPME